MQGEGCAQHESTQPGPLTLLPHKTLSKLGGVGGPGKKHEKTRKTFRSCMARLLRSYIQDFFRCPPRPTPPRRFQGGRRWKGEVKPSNSVQHATQGPADIMYMYIYVYSRVHAHIHTDVWFSTYMYVHMQMRAYM